MKGRYVALIVIGVLLAMFAMCFGGFLLSGYESDSEDAQRVLVTREVEVTREVSAVEVEVEKIVEVEVIREIETEIEVVVTATPISQPTPYVFLDIEGHGDRVTENFAFPSCSKAVFHWTTDHCLSVDIINVDTGGEDYFGGCEGPGASLEPISAGVYYLVTSNTRNWTIRGECQD